MSPLLVLSILLFSLPTPPPSGRGPSSSAMLSSAASPAVDLVSDWTGPSLSAAGSGPHASSTGSERAAGGYRWPLGGTPAVVRRFGPPPQPWLPGHRGVDLAGAPGATVRAAGAGVVVFAGRIAGRGVVSMRHSSGLRTTYEPVDPAVAAGAALAAGAPLGTLAGGHPGCPVAACLHWGLRSDTRYYDPLLLLGYGRVRLLPIERASG